MTDLYELLAKSLVAQDKTRDRSKQTSLGPSSLGSCQRQVWYHLNSQPVTNSDTEALAAILGTFIHAGVAESIKREDPFGDNFLIEQKFYSNDPDCGIESGNVDLFIKDLGLVVDWKTTKKKSLRYFPSLQQIWQVQTYGWLLEQNGHKVNNVSLVAIPRDGNMSDIRVHVEQYDPFIVKDALGWLKKIKESDVAPEAEKPAPFCASYCKFYDPTGEIGCRGMKK